MRSYLVLVLSLSSITLPSVGLAQSKDAIIDKVDRHYNHLASLQTHYTEHYTGMGMDRTESGTLLLKKPGRMRWSYASPAGKVFILDGKNGWFYTPGNPQAQRVSAKQLDDLRSPLRLLLGHTQLKKELENITINTVDQGHFQISGIPKGMQQRIKLVTLITDSNGLINSMQTDEVDGANTLFTFSDTQENVMVNDASFRFTPPAGVTVVDGLPPI